jgi:regulation of enolase protein 1 (concanavalin A-like superfamily)
MSSVVASALGHSDFYINPGGSDSGDAESLMNAATLLGAPPEGDFQFSARVSVGFRSQFDAGVLMVWVDARRWAKFCFEYSPAGEPMVVSVVTREVSDDANAFTASADAVWMRVSRLGQVYAFHASTDRRSWRLVRVFTLGDDVGDHRIGFEVQSPTGEGCTVRFDEVGFVQRRLGDLRDGS